MVQKCHLYSLKRDEVLHLTESVPCVLVGTAQAVDKIHYESPDHVILKVSV